MYADEILDYSGVRPTGVVAGSYGPTADQSPEAGGTITVPALTVDKNGAVTGATNRTITLPSGGGGGAEEQFEKVYEETLSEATANDTYAIRSEDMDGLYVDVVAYVNLPSSATAENLTIVFYDETAQVPIGLKVFSGITSGHRILACAGIQSVNGLCFVSGTIADNIAGTVETGGGFFFADLGSPEYPSESTAGVALVDLIVDDGVFPARTKFTVYARRKVAEPGPPA